MATLFEGQQVGRVRRVIGWSLDTSARCGVDVPLELLIRVVSVVADGCSRTHGAAEGEHKGKELQIRCNGSSWNEETVDFYRPQITEKSTS